MKKRLLLISLVLSLLLTMVMPGTAIARSRAIKCPPTSFSAAAEVMVVDPGTSTQYGMTVVTRGEQIQGQFVYAEGWDSMLGATLSVRHSSVITLSPTSPEAGTFSGNAWAFIAVSLSGDGGSLFGTYQATLTGDYLITADGMIFNNVVDSGQFAVAGRDGRSFVTASGSWVASLFWTEVAPGVFTLAGPAQIAGEYRTIGH